MISFLDLEKKQSYSLILLLNGSTKPMTIDDIAESLGYSRPTIKKILLLTQIKLAEFNFNILQNTDKTYFLSTDLHSFDINTTSYLNVLLTDSLPYRIIEHLFNYGKINSDIMCAKYYISRTTFTRKKNKLLKEFHENNLNLSSEFQLESEEKNRLFFFYFLKKQLDKKKDESYRDVFNFINTHETPFIKNISDNQKESLALFLFISLKRNSLSKFIIPYDWYLDSSSLHSQVNIFLYDLYDHYAINISPYINSEITFLMGFLYTEKIVNLEIYPINKFQEIIPNKKLFYASSLSWIENFKLKFSIELDSYQEFLLFQEIILMHLKLEFFYIDYSIFIPKFSNSNDLLLPEKAITSFYYYNMNILYNSLLEDSLYAHYRRNNLHVIPFDTLITFFYLFSFPIVSRLLSIRTVSIFVHNSINKQIEISIKNELYLFFGNQISISDTLTNDIEIILTDISFGKEHLCKEFYINSMDEKSKITKIYTSIENYIHKKKSYL